MAKQTKAKNKIALITGITGQDGSYLAELLLSKGYEVHGIVKRASTHHRPRLNHLEIDKKNEKNLFLHFGDLDDAGSIRRLIFEINPDEFYNLAAQSDVRVSFDIPEYTSNVTGLGVIRILETIKDYQTQTNKKIKFYQASSSEMFGSTPAPQNEKTMFHPRSPYACAKTFAHYATVNYREAYNIFACSGILFNHESPRRGENFVTRKITFGVARILVGLEKKLYLGNIESQRDWGYAKEYVEAMWLMLQQPKPDDYVIGTGKATKISDFIKYVFEHAGIKNWKKYVEIDPQFYRPTEVNILRADASKAKRVLKWKPKMNVKQLAKIMLEADILKITKEG